MLSNMTVSYIMNITQVCRRELLCSILEMHSTVAVKATLENLNLDDLAERTEGFVARDLQGNERINMTQSVSRASR